MDNLLYRGVLLVLWCSATVYGNGGRYPVSHPGSHPVNNGTGVIGASDVQCRWGMGYPVSCPGNNYPRDNNKCCRDHQEPHCCKQRARTICGIYHDGFTTRTATFSYDPGPQWLTIWCPTDGDSHEDTMCCFSKTFGYPYRRMSCCSPKRVWGIVGGVIGGVVLIGAITFVVCRCRAHRRASRATTLASTTTYTTPDLNTTYPDSTTTITAAVIKTETDTLEPPPGAMAPPSYDTTTGGAGYVPPYPPATAPGYPQGAPPAYPGPGYPAGGYQTGYTPSEATPYPPGQPNNLSDATPPYPPSDTTPYPTRPAKQGFTFK